MYFVVGYALYDHASLESISFQVVWDLCLISEESVLRFQRIICSLICLVEGIWQVFIESIRFCHYWKGTFVTDNSVNWVGSRLIAIWCHYQHNFYLKITEYRDNFEGKVYEWNTKVLNGKICKCKNQINLSGFTKCSPILYRYVLRRP